MNTHARSSMSSVSADTMDIKFQLCLYEWAVTLHLKLICPSKSKQLPSYIHERSSHSYMQTLTW